MSLLSIDRALAIQWACAILVGATVFFNPMLALVNAHGLTMSSGMVALVQATIVLSAFALGAAQPSNPPYAWLATAWLMIMALIAINAAMARFNPKPIGDVLLIPAFIMLGMRMKSDTLIRTVIVLQISLLVVSAWELFLPGIFGSTFKVTEYYVNTRGFKAQAFWAGGDLFLSSQRPQGRYLLAWSGLHRGSSLFLEPVSLGNWAIVSTIFTAGFWRELTINLRLFMIASIWMLLIVCDGRLALSVTLFLAIYLPVARMIPGRLATLYLPSLILVLLIAQSLGYLSEIGDNFSGRLHVGMMALQQFDVPRLLGITAHPIAFDDAGWADLIQSQSIFVAGGLWLMLMLTDIGSYPGGRMVKHGIALFITLCLPVSNSILSIKTVGLMWACYGVCYARAHQKAKTGKAP